MMMMMMMMMMIKIMMMMMIMKNKKNKTKKKKNASNSAFFVQKWSSLQDRPDFACELLYYTHVRNQYIAKGLLLFFSST